MEKQYLLTGEMIVSNLILDGWLLIRIPMYSFGFITLWFQTLFYLVSSLYKIAFSFGIILAVLSFKPCFIWLAPYTISVKFTEEEGRRGSFKPCFIWLAPYTVFDDLYV